MASITSVASAVLGRRSRSQLSRLARIAKISVEAIKSLKPKIADAMQITAVLRYTASSIYLPLSSSLVSLARIYRSMYSLAKLGRHR